MKDPTFIKIGVTFGTLLAKTKWWQFRKRKLLEKGIIASYLDYQGHHDLANKIIKRSSLLEILN